MKIYEIYCPICGRYITADNKADVDSGVCDAYIFIHDNIAHSDDDIDALSNLIN